TRDPRLRPLSRSRPQRALREYRAGSGGMTFSIAGRCAATGMFGVAIATSSVCVGARCPHARAGIGAVATQNVTDPDLGPLLLDEMAQGHSARDAIALVAAGRRD